MSRLFGNIVTVILANKMARAKKCLFNNVSGLFCSRIRCLVAGTVFEFTEPTSRLKSAIFCLNQPVNPMKTLAFLVISFIASAITLQAQTNPAVRKQQFNLENSLAIQGYDPVAYFTQKKAVKGSAENSITYKNVTYRFATAANADAFQKSPTTYEPAYGGWCAYAMGATGEKVPVDPETFKVKDGHLYLFYNKFFNNTLPKWNKDEENLHRKADQSWLKFVGTNS